jgi:hypothetical protein
MPKRLYLETSVIRSRLFGHSSIRNLLIKKLENQIKITSPFVIGEFNSGFICDLIEFYFVLDKSASIKDAIKYWTEEYRIRKIKNINFAIAEVFVGIDDGDITRGLFVLRNLIKKIIISLKCLINRYEKNETRCHLATHNLEFGSYKTVNDIERAFVHFYDFYRKSHHIDQCRVVALFDKSKELLKKIREVKGTEEGLDRQQKCLDEIANGTRELSCATCKIIGDTIIVLESPDYAILLSLDSVFDDLCKVLGRKFEIIPSVRKMLPIGSILAKLRGTK